MAKMASRPRIYYRITEAGHVAYATPECRLWARKSAIIAGLVLAALALLVVNWQCGLTGG